MPELVSIIIPVYNAEAYLHQCLEAIASQTYKDFECLCVNNNSTDGSGEIIHQFQMKDGRFHSLFESYKGPSAARNHGLRVAKGKYIAFVDADDEIEPDYLVEYVNAIESSGADVVIGGYTRGEQKIENYVHGGKLIDHLTTGTGGVVWAKLYKSELIGQIRFDEDLAMREDLLFNLLIARDRGTVADELQSYKYKYRDTEGSLVKKHGKTIESEADAVLAISDELAFHGDRYVSNFLKNIFLFDAIFLAEGKRSCSEIMKTKVFKKYGSAISCVGIKDKVLYKPLLKGRAWLSSIIYRLYVSLR